MGLIKEIALIPIKLIGDQLARPPHMPLVIGGTELNIDGEPDEPWADPIAAIQRERLQEFYNNEADELNRAVAAANGEEQVTRTQWGLRLPNGEVQWDGWQGILFLTPLDRLKMIATLQQTAIDMGLNEGEQTEEFINRYSWQTREQTSRIRYRNTESYALTDSEVSAAPREASNDYPHQGDSPRDLLKDPYRNIHQRSMGGST